MKRRRIDWETLQVIGVLLVFLFCLVGVPLLSMAAYDWDWRCLFAQCRVDK